MILFAAPRLQALPGRPSAAASTVLAFTLLAMGFASPLGAQPAPAPTPAPGGGQMRASFGFTRETADAFAEDTPQPTPTPTRSRPSKHAEATPEEPARHRHYRHHRRHHHYLEPETPEAPPARAHRPGWFTRLKQWIATHVPTWSHPPKPDHQ